MEGRRMINIQEEYQKSFIRELDFGFLGEIYITPASVHELEEDIVQKYFSQKKPYLASRNWYYYQTDINIYRKYIYEYEQDILKVIHLNICQKDKYLILYTLYSYLLNDIAKAIGTVFANESLRSKNIERLKIVLDQCSKNIIKIIFETKIEKFEYIDFDILCDVVEAITSLKGACLREYTEMDHMDIIIQSFMVYSKYLTKVELLICPLQGSCIVPAIYKALFEAFTDKTIEYDYIRFSNYDTQQFMSKSPEEYSEDIKKKYGKNKKVMILDDNAGTGKTILSLKKLLENHFENITTGVIECRWDTKIKPSNYPAFNINAIDIITPLEYRHYAIFDEKIANIRSKDSLHPDYEEAFYKSEFIYKKIDFEEYLNESEALPCNRARLKAIVKAYKQLNPS